MSKPSPKTSKPELRVQIANNRKARHNYFIVDTIEAGIVLEGSEVKSLRAGHVSIQESHAGERSGRLYLLNMLINEYREANRQNHEPTRARLLLLHGRQINKLLGAIQKQGMTIVPLSLYFNEKGRVKVELGLAKGKNLVDKRHTEQERDWNREKARLLRDKG